MAQNPQLKKPSGEYHPEDFAKLLLKILGDRDQKELARITGISREYISRVLCGKVLNRPTRSTVRKLLSAINTDKDAMQLKIITGYSDQELGITGNIPVSPLTIPNISKDYVLQFFTMIMNYLTMLRQERGIRWILEYGSNTSDTLIVSFPEGKELNTWKFICLPSSADCHTIKYQDVLNYHLSQIATEPLPVPAKVTFITSDAFSYQYTAELKPCNLALTISVMKTNFATETIEEEIYLPSAAKELSMALRENLLLQL